MNASTLHWIAGALFALFAAGCSAQVDLGKVHGPQHVTTTIHYSGVRAAERRFPDYSAIDRAILADRK